MPLARVIALAAVAIVVAAPGAGAVPAGPTVLAYPSAQSIPPSGRLPQGGAPIVTLNAAIGEREGAWLVVTGAQSVSAKIDGGGLGKLKADLSFAHFVSFGAARRSRRAAALERVEPSGREAEPAALPPGLRPAPTPSPAATGRR